MIGLTSGCMAQNKTKMKAAQHFEVLVDSKGERYFQPHKSGEELPKGIKIVNFKKGEDVPKKLLADLIMHNKEYLEVTYKDGRVEIPEGVDLTIQKAEEEIRQKAMKGNKYSYESLEALYKKKGWNKFRKWAKQKFGVTDSSKTALMSEIMAEQDKMVNSGEVVL